MQSVRTLQKIIKIILNSIAQCTNNKIIIIVPMNKLNSYNIVHTRYSLNTTKLYIRTNVSKTLYF